MTTADALHRRPKRADARRNYDKLIEAARAAFTEKGTEASLEDIARRAEVGIGTLYRHFPTHADLIRALHLRLIARIDAVVEQLDTVEPGWDALVAYIDGVLAVFRDVPAATAVTERMSRTDPTTIPGARWSAALEPHVVDLRAGVTADDVAAMPFLLAGGIRFPDLLERQRAIVLAGLRA